MYRSRVFYETLLAQVPTSEMAQEWCLAYGVMDEVAAKKAFKALQKRKEKAGGGRSRSPPPASVKSEKKGGGKKKKRRVLEDAEYDAGMGAGGDEGIGVAAL